MPPFADYLYRSSHMILSLCCSLLCSFRNMNFSRRYANQNKTEVRVILIAFLYCKAMSHEYNPKYPVKQSIKRNKTFTNTSSEATGTIHQV